MHPDGKTVPREIKNIYHTIVPLCCVDSAQCHASRASTNTIVQRQTLSWWGMVSNCKHYIRSRCLSLLYFFLQCIAHDNILPIPSACMVAPSRGLKMMNSLSLTHVVESPWSLSWLETRCYLCQWPSFQSVSATVKLHPGPHCHCNIAHRHTTTNNRPSHLQSAASTW